MNKVTQRRRAIAALFAGAMCATPFAASAGPTVIELTQTGCQFLESEHDVDHGYRPASADECKTVNASTASSRLATAKVIELDAGDYVFRVTNRDVPYGLGFWLRGDGVISRARLPSVSGGGLVEGATKDYEIRLEPGEYVYSCPLNPTPDYKLVVRKRS